MTQRRTTVQDIARHLGISPGTVSQALNDARGVSPVTRRRVKEYAELVHYRPNQLARAIKAGRSYLVAVVLTRLTDSFHEAILQGIENTAMLRGYDIVITSVTGSDVESRSRNAEKLVSRLLGRQIDALAATVYSLPEAAVSLLDQAGVPLVYLAPEPVEGRTSVSVDNMLGGRCAAEHLFDLGHRHILFLGGSNRYSQLRAEGARQVLAERGDGAILEMREAEGDGNLTAAYYAVATRLRSRRDFTAIFCANDLFAAGASKAILDAGLSIPGDISVVGFDDLRWTQLITPALTTIHQPQVSQGEVAMEMMIQMIEDGATPSRVLPPRLVIRDSTSTPPRPRKE